MAAKYFFVDNGSHRQAIEAIGKSLPQFDIVPSLAFIIETINTVNAGTFVVSSQEKEILRILDFIS